MIGQTTIVRDSLPAAQGCFHRYLPQARRTLSQCIREPEEEIVQTGDEPVTSR